MINRNPYNRMNRQGRALLITVIAMVSLLSIARRASAHEGPPYPIMTDKVIGPCVVSVWADPDVGTGTFYIILDPPQGGTMPEDITIEIGVRPVSGRLPETRHKATREDLKNRTQFNVQIPFDAEERWLTRIFLNSSQGGGEAAVEVEVTPPGYGSWDLLVYPFPFLLIGFLWIKAVLRRRKSKKAAAN